MKSSLLVLILVVAVLVSAAEDKKNTVEAKVEKKDG